MKTKKTLLQITERNIDGCGSDASALLLVDFPEDKIGEGAENL